MADDKEPDITVWLKAVREGRSGAHEQLMPRVYESLRRRAGSMMRRESAGHTLGPTALVHETYLKLIDQNRVEWQDRAHFFAIASTAMRRILVDHARGRQSQKRGGAQRNLSLEDDDVVVAVERDEDVLALDDALKKLQTLDERQARIVELRFFGGLTNVEVAEALGISERTVRGEWAMVRAWLRREFDQEGE